jgi:iron complex transport system permease protein
MPSELMSFRKPKLWLALLAAALPLCFVLNLVSGSVDIPIAAVSDILRGVETERTSWRLIVWELRLPKAITAILAGAALSVSGLQMQTIFRNALAGPYVLGITSGASLGVALVVMAGTWLQRFTGFFTNLLHTNWVLAAAAISGSAIAMLLVIFFIGRVRSSAELLIVGLMLGSITGALVSIMEYFSQAEDLKRYVIWMFGSLGSTDWPKLSVLVPVILGGLIWAMLSFKSLNLLLLGDTYAQSMGLHTKRVQLRIIVITSILAGTITAFCGPIGFIGIAVPHLSRQLLRTHNHLYLLPATALLGAVLLLVCDILCHLPTNGKVLPINILTALLGAPVVIWLMVRKRS